MDNYDPIGGGFIVQGIVDFFSGPGVQGSDFSTIYKIIGFFKFIFIFFLILFIFGIIYVIMELQKLRPGYKLVYDPNDVPQAKLAKNHWKQIIGKFDAGSESDWRLAIIEADSLVEEVFKKIGFEGESLGDRIAAISQQELHSVTELRDAHSIRNKLVHTPGYTINKQDAERAMRHYQKVLEELEVI